MIQNERLTSDNLRALSPQDFLSYGVQDVAYVREIHVDGKNGYAVHAADGTPLSVMDSLEEALHIIQHNDLESALLH